MPLAGLLDVELRLAEEQRHLLAHGLELVALGEAGHQLVGVLAHRLAALEQAERAVGIGGAGAGGLVEPVLDLADDPCRLAPDEDVAITNIFPSNGSFVKTPFLMRADIVSKENLQSLEMYFNGNLSVRLNLSGASYPFQWYVFDALKSQNTVQFVVRNAKGKEVRKSVILYN